MIALAVFGLTTSLGITRVAAANPAKKFRANFLAEFNFQFRSIRADRILLLAVMGNTFIWFLAALFQPTILFYGKDILHLDDTQSGYLQAALAIGIGVGSAASGFLSGKKIEYGLVPLGAFGLTVFGALLSRSALSFHAVALNLALLGFSGGFYLVPISALIQQRPDHANTGGVIAASAFLSWVGIIFASGIYFLFTSVLKLTPPQIFLAGAAMTFAGAVYALTLLPDALIRFILWFLTKTIYRIRVEGLENIPERGGAFFVCNHVSFVDAPLLMAATDRQIRLIMDKSYYELRWIKPFGKILGLIPIASTLGPRELIQSLHAASDAIRAGDVVCIFAEGQITRTGELNEFHRGYERIMKNVTAPIVPVALVGIWGSLFSFERGKIFWKWPHHIFYPVTVRFGKSLPPTATPDEVRATVAELIQAG